MEGHDFFEGVRCLLKEKGAKPSWEYKMMSKVPQEIIDSYFAPFSMEELELQI